MGLKAQLLVPTNDSAVADQSKAVPTALRGLLKEAHPSPHDSPRDAAFKRHDSLGIYLVLCRSHGLAVD
jgi:hypothetical protein